MKKNIKIIITKNNDNSELINEYINDDVINNIYKKEEKNIYYNLQYFINIFQYLINNIHYLIKKYIILIFLIILYFFIKYT
jgi:hypothetical protein